MNTRTRLPVDEAWLREDLRGWLAELARDPRLGAAGLELERRTQPPAGRAPCASSRLERARRELVAVHRAEFALLLRQAARLRLGREGAFLEACRAGLREVLACARADGLHWPRRLERLAHRLSASAPPYWPAALRLARCAHALAPCGASRRLLAEALAAGGHGPAAAALLAAALLERPPAARARGLLRDLVGLLAGLRRELPTRAAALALARARRAPWGRGAA